MIKITTEISDLSGAPDEEQADDDDAWRRLSRRGADEPTIEVFGEGRYAPSSSVAVGAAVVLRIAPPTGFDSGQALVFERRPDGAITLLSTGAVTTNVVRYRDRFELPRQDASHDGGRAVSLLRYQKEGRRELLAVLSADRRLRLDRDPVFVTTKLEGAPPTEPWRGVIERLDRGAFAAFASRLEKSGATSWRVVVGTLAIHAT